MTEPLDLTSRLRAWSYRRQQLTGCAPSLAIEALRRVVAVYSSHPSAPLSLLCRDPTFTAERLSELEQRRETLRLPAMRQSIFLLPAETAPCIFAATRLPPEKLAPRLRYAGLDADGYVLLTQRVLAAAQDPITPAGLQQAVTTDARLMTALRVMAHEGHILRLGSSPRSDNPRYVATEAWLGCPLQDADPTRSLQWLADAYLRGYGPARIKDFAWWSGIPRRRAALALAAVTTVDVGGGHVLPADQESDFAQIEPVDANAVALLPKWDAYSMGYAPDGRQRLIDDQHLGKAYSTRGQGGGTSGDGLPLVLRGGRGVASWSHRFEGNRLRVQITPFDPGALPPALDERVFEEVGRLLGATGVEIRLTTSAI